MKICLSIAPESVPEARELLQQIPESVELVEVRTDAMYAPDMDALLRPPRPDVIITNRCAEEGGGFNGKEADQFNFLSEACRCGAEYVDVELKWGKRFYMTLRKKYPRTRFILSHHDFSGTPKSLLSLYRTMRKVKPDIIKIAAMTHRIEDNGIIMEILKEARRDRQPIVAFCMGEYGQPMRILGGLTGAFLTFGYDERRTPTAPGQLSISALTTLYRVHNLHKQSRIFGLVGNPVSQSRGIHFHNGVFSERRLQAVYLNFLADRFDSFISTFGDLVSGVSVTMPFKQDAAAFVSRFGDDSSCLGATNTILFSRGKTIGYNTDLLAVQSLLKSEIHLKGKSAVVIGSGAMARTMAYAALHGGANVTVAGRSPECTTALAGALGCRSIPLDAVPSIHCDILMNGTSVGMKPGIDPDLVPKKFLRKVNLVVEAVYVPEETQLLRNAKQAGCKIITGLDIFETQAAMQSSLFCGMM